MFRWIKSNLVLRINLSIITQAQYSPNSREIEQVRLSICSHRFAIEFEETKITALETIR